MATKKQQTTTEMVKISALIFDPTVNVRPPRQSKIDKYAADFDPEALGVIEVSARPGRKYVVLDGQHRVVMLRDKLGWNNGQEVLCKIHRGLSHAEEARLFVKLNDETPVSAIHKMLGKIEGGEDPDAAINAIVESVGLKVSDHTSDGNIAAANALHYVWAGATGSDGTKKSVSALRDRGEAHPELLRQTLRLLLNAWGKNRYAYRRDVLTGTGAFLAHHGSNPTLDMNGLADRLSLYEGGPAAFAGEAAGLRRLMHCSSTHAVAGLMVNVYNQKRRSSKLPGWWS